MRKLKKGRKFSRKKDQRKAFLKSLSRALFLHERIITTEARAKEIARFAEPFITKAKKKDLAARRHLLRFFGPLIVKKIVEDIAPRYATRAGGYTRVIKLGQRRTNGAKMAIIELVS